MSNPFRNVLSESLVIEPEDAHSIVDMFSSSAPFPKELIKETAAKMLRSEFVAGQKLQINLDPGDGSDILVKKVNPKVASGYLVFKDESAYKDWLNAHLYEPTQEQIMEATKRGTGP